MTPSTRPTDPDMGSVNYDLMGDDKNLFTLNASRMLVFKTAPDHEDPMDRNGDNVYEVTVRVTDGTMHADLMVEVTVTDVNEAPMIVRGGLAVFGPSSQNYLENGMDAVGTYRASGPEAATAAWSLEGADDNDFMVDRSGESAMLRFRSAPDYENPTDMNEDNTYEVTLKATDGTNMATHDVTVMVTNVDELGTLSGDSSPSYMENSDDDVATYTADGLMADDAIWSLEGTDMRDFTITGGTLNFRSAPDFETPRGGSGNDSNTYMVTVKAKAGGEMEMVDVTVTVTNEDEDGMVTLMPMRPIVGTEITADLTDEDIVTESPVTWQWSKSMTTTDGTFTPITGATSATYTPVEADAGYYLKATAMYTDGEGSGKMADKMTVSSVSLFEIDGPTSRSYMENGMDAVATYTASGPGADMATWTLEGDDAGDFTITGGMLEFMSSPNYEMPMGGSGNDSNTYMVTVKASDGTMTDTRAVTVMVTNVDELGTLSGDPSHNYMENSDAAVGTYTADGPMAEMATWSLMGADMGDLSISSSGGVLTFDATPNYEMPMDEDMDNTYTVTVMAEAGGEMATQDVTVTVTNVEEPGTVTLMPASPRVGTEISAALTDPDNVTAGTVTWQWSQSMTMDGSFTDIDMATSMTYTAVADDEGYYLKATASYTDGHGSDKSASGMTAMTASQVTFAISGTPDPSYMENGTDAVGTYTASGPEAATATWMLEGTDAGDFMVEGSGASVMLKFSSPPDYENPGDAGTDSTYQVTLKATAGTNMATHDVTVAVTNVEELGTLSGDSSPSYMENGEGAVGTYTASDGSMSDVANWSLMGADMGYLSISSSGVLTFDATPNYEMPMDEDMDNTYTVTVMAEAGGEMDEILVTVMVTNVNEDGTVTLSTQEPMTGMAITADLTDPDIATENTDTWQWSKSMTMDGTYVDIDMATSMSYTPMTADVGYYLRATVMYTDGHGPGKAAMETTTSMVTAAADPLLVKYDTDPTNGRIDRSEVITAIRDYFADPVSFPRADVIKVIRLYFSTLDS